MKQHHAPHRLVTLKISEDLLREITRAASAAELPPAEMIRRALEGAFFHFDHAHDEYREVHQALAEAEGWLDLQSRLRGAGFVLRMAEGEALMLCSWPIERHILPLVAFDTDLAELSLRYRAPFPAGLYPRLPEGALTRATNRQAS